MFNVAFVSSEIAPYASTGGLAEVCGSLPRALTGLGVNVTMFMPMYRSILEGNHPVEDTGLRLSIPVGFHRYRADIWRTRSNKSPVIYFIRRDEFFDRTQLYSLPDRDYDDNFERFIFFQKAVTALIHHLGQPFDIVHAHDWQTGLLPLYLRHGLSGEGRHKTEKVVFTIHNLAYQGIFGGDYYSYTNLPFSCFSVDMLEYYGNVSCLKGGINSADILTTVSETYVREIQEVEQGCGLHGVIRDAAAKLRGIVNGIDLDAWNPATDQLIAARYDHRDLTAKNECKADILRRCKLKTGMRDPLLGMVTRLTTSKGIELIDESLPELMHASSAGLVVLGAGTSEMIELINEWAKKWPGRVSVKTGFDSKLARRIIAGADIFLMPSKTEPCGLNQLYSLRYGTIPVVHAVGGLADTVVDVSATSGQGYGFTFQEYNAGAFAGTVKRAMNLYSDQHQWRSVQVRAMAQDYGWSHSARQYLKVYAEVLGRPMSPDSL